MALAGVVRRFWSSSIEPSCRIPGVTTSRLWPWLSAMALILPASSPEAITPSQPACSAFLARKITRSATETLSLYPISCKSVASMLVSTVTVNSFRELVPFALTAASIMGVEPWIVRNVTPRLAARPTAVATVAGMS